MSGFYFGRGSLRLSFKYIGFFLLVSYFSIAPVYEQPWLPDGAWYGLKIGLLLALVSVGAGWALLTRRLSLGPDDLIFLIVIIISLLYTLRGQGLAYVLMTGYLFYFLGKMYVRLLGADALFESLVNVARLSALYALYMVVSYYTGRTESIVSILNPNTWALYSVISISLLFYHSMISGSRLSWFLCIPFVISIFFSESRGGLLIALSLFVLFLAHQKNWKAFLIAAFFMVVSLLTAYSVLGLSESRIFVQLEVLRHGGSVDLTTGRMDGYLIALEILPNYFFGGAGDVDLNDYGLGYRRVHNFYLRLLLEFGFFFFLFFSLFIAYMVAKVVTAPRSFKMLSKMTVIVLLLPLLYEPSGLFGNFLVAGTLWFIVGALAGTGKGVRARRKSYDVSSGPVSSVFV